MKTFVGILCHKLCRSNPIRPMSPMPPIIPIRVHSRPFIAPKSDEGGFAVELHS